MQIDNAQCYCCFGVKALPAKRSCLLCVGPRELSVLRVERVES